MRKLIELCGPFGCILPEISHAFSFLFLFCFFFRFFFSLLFFVFIFGANFSQNGEHLKGLAPKLFLRRERELRRIEQL